MDPMHDSEFDMAPQKVPAEMRTIAPFKGIPCLHCPETESVVLNLATMEFKCTECDNEWTVKDVRTTIQIWLRVLNWVVRIHDQE